MCNIDKVLESNMPLINKIYCLDETISHGITIIKHDYYKYIIINYSNNKMVKVYNNLIHKIMLKIKDKNA